MSAGDAVRVLLHEEASTRASTRPGSTMTDLKFEDCLARLEQIVGALETGNLPLEDSLKVFEEGVGLARHCSRYLEEAEKPHRAARQGRERRHRARARWRWEGEDEA